MSLDRHIFMIKYGKPERQENALRAAVRHVENDPEGEYDAGQAAHALYKHRQSHGTNKGIDKAIDVLSNLSVPDEDES